MDEIDLELNVRVRSSHSLQSSIMDISSWFAFLFRNNVPREKYEAYGFVEYGTQKLKEGQRIVSHYSRYGTYWIFAFLRDQSQDIYLKANGFLYVPLQHLKCIKFTKLFQVTNLQPREYGSWMGKEKDAEIFLTTRRDSRFIWSNWTSTWTTVAFLICTVYRMYHYEHTLPICAIYSMYDLLPLIYLVQRFRANQFAERRGWV